jgi:hypothetical protein
MLKEKEKYLRTGIVFGKVLSGSFQVKNGE